MSRPTTAVSSSPSPPILYSSDSSQQQGRSSSRNPISPGFIERRFGRRPKTAQNNLSLIQSTSNLSIPSLDSLPTQARAALPSSFSSSHLHLATVNSNSSGANSSASQIQFPSSDENASAAASNRRIPLTSRLRPSTANDSSARAASSTPNQGTHMTSAANPALTSSSGGGSAFGRMFRRYSQGGSVNNLSREPASVPLRTAVSNTPPFTAASPTSTMAAPMATAARPPIGSSSNPLVSSPADAANGHALPNSQSMGLSNSQTLAVFPTEPAQIMSSQPTNASVISEPHHASRETNDSSASPAVAPPVTPAASTSFPEQSSAQDQVHRIRLVPHLEASRSLHFEPIERDAKEGASPVKIGRFTDRNPPPPSADPSGPPNGLDFGTAGAEPTAHSTVGQPGARGGAIPISGSHGGAGRIDSSRIAFKSKVVSRGHSEIWCEAGGKFFIRDTKSSSGTFLNHIRLSAPNVESRPFSLKDGDIIQLGVDYQGGTEEIYRCVKMRVELNRGWQRGANQFNVNALRQLRALQGSPLSLGVGKEKAVSEIPTNRQNVSVTDCCICLFSVTVCQALFIAPCSHVFHYKCIRPLLTLHHPGFSCPLCRTFADLDADVEEDEAWQEDLIKQAAATEELAVQGKPAIEVGTPRIDTKVFTSPLAAESADATRVASSSPIPDRQDISASTSDCVLRTATHTSSPLSNGSNRAQVSKTAKTKVDWGRPGTAVASSAGHLLNTDATALPSLFGHSDEAHLGDGHAAQVAELASVDRILQHGAQSRDHVSPLASANGIARRAPCSPRRGSSPIDISRGSQLQSHPPSHSTLAFNATAAGLSPQFSPNLDESRTPLNHMFLSTLAETPVVNIASRDFPTGRSAPALPPLVPATNSKPSPSSPLVDSSLPQSSSDGSMHRHHSSEGGGDDAATAEDDPLDGNASPRLATSARDRGKDKRRVGDMTHVSDAEQTNVHLTLTNDKAEPKPLLPLSHCKNASESKRRARSRARSISGARQASASRSDSDDVGTSPMHSPPSQYRSRPGANLNASAYMQRSQTSNGINTNGNSQGTLTTATTHGSERTSSSQGSKITKFKKRISGAI